MRTSVAVNLMLSLLLSGAAHSFAASDAPASSGVASLAELLRAKGMLTAEEYDRIKGEPEASPTSRSDLKALVDILRSKGSLTGEEASAFLQSVTSKPFRSQNSVQRADAVKPTGGNASASTAVEDELRVSLLLLKEQGVLGNDEVNQITQRIGRKWSAADEDEKLADPELEIEYSRTSLPQENLLARLETLQQKGVITPAEQERIADRFKQKLALEQVTDDLGTSLRGEIDRQVAEKILPVPEWVRRIKFSGDVRLRYDGSYFSDSNDDYIKAGSSSELYNTSMDRHRMRLRARLGATAKVNDYFDAGIGLATGNTTDPVSTNSTLGDSLNKKSFQLDLAYLKWKPTPATTVWGGRFANPWFCTDLVWDSDINFDGIAFSYRPRMTRNLNLFLTAGAFPLQEVELSSKDKWLFGGQLGAQYRDGNSFTAKLGVAYYDFRHTHGVVNEYGMNTNDWTAPGFMQKGNTLMDINQIQTSGSAKYAYAADFRELNLTGSLDLGFWNPVRVVLTGDYVRNLGYSQSEVTKRGGVSPGDLLPKTKKENEGYQFGVTVGHEKTDDLGKWKTYLFYKYLEADAVMDAYTDSDFHQGGTNAKGWVVGGDLGVARNVWLSTRWLSANEISGPSLGIDVLQFNINARF